MSKLILFTINPNFISTFKRSRKNRKQYLTLLLTFVWLITNSFSANIQITSIDQLDELAEFHFSILSDNKGKGVNVDHIDRMSRWAKEGEFILGLGDHLVSKSRVKVSKNETSSTLKKSFFI